MWQTIYQDCWCHKVFVRGVWLNVFLFQKDSPSKPSVAELAGRFKGHILPTPTSNDEVPYLCRTCHNIPTKIPVTLYVQYIFFEWVHMDCLWSQDLITAPPPFCLQLPFRRRPPCYLKLQNQKDDDEESDVSNFVSLRTNVPQISLLNKQRSKRTQICLLFTLITTSQCQHRTRCTVARSAISVFFFFCLKHWESCVCAAVFFFFPVNWLLNKTLDLHCAQLKAQSIAKVQKCMHHKHNRHLLLVISLFNTI